MKKKRMLFLILFMCMFIFAQKVDARTCEYGIPSPPIYYNGSWTNDIERSFTTSAESCYAENMYVYFSNGSYTANAGLAIEAVLMEKDTTGNEPDQAKIYYGSQTLTTLQLNWTLATTIPGRLDSQGDQGCELYMKFRLREPLSTTSREYWPADMFRYTICVD